MALQITPEMLAGPAMAPPQGVIPNFVDPWSCGDVLIGVGGALSALMVIFVGARLTVKLHVNGRMTWDDATCFMGMLLTLLYFGVSVAAVKYAKYGTHMWNVTLATFLSDSTGVISYLTQVVAPITLGFIKVTFFILFFQLFKPAKTLKIAILFGLIFTIVFYLLATILSFISATPRPGETWISHDEFNPIEHIESTEGIWLPTVGLVIDLYILILPLYAVSTLHLSLKRKLEVAAVFMAGIVAVVASILCLAFRAQFYQDPLNDLTYAQIFTLTSSLVEMTLGVIVSCMPAFSKLIRHVIQPGYLSLRSRLTGSRNTGSQYTRTTEITSSTKPSTSSLIEHKEQPVGLISIKKGPIYTGTGGPHSAIAAADKDKRSEDAWKTSEGIRMQYDIQVESRGRENGDMA